MRKILMLLIVFGAGKVFAQDYALGIKAGVNYSQSVILDVVSTDGVDMDDLETQKGSALVFGAFATATYGKFMIQPEILFSENQSLVSLDDVNIEDLDLSDFLSINVDKVDVPIIFGYKAFNTIRLTGGPVFSHVSVETGDPLFSFSDMTLGYQAGIGFDIKKLTFDARYEGNLSKFEEYIETESGTISVDTRKSLFQFTMGYKLFD
jgi:hypothetical protein